MRTERRDLETTISGAVLVDPDCWEIAKGIVKSGDFSTPVAREIVEQLETEGWSESLRGQHRGAEAELNPQLIDSRDLKLACVRLRLAARGMVLQDVHSLRDLCDRAIAGDQDAWWLVKPLVLRYFEGA